MSKVIVLVPSEDKEIIQDALNLYSYTNYMINGEIKNHAVNKLYNMFSKEVVGVIIKK